MSKLPAKSAQCPNVTCRSAHSTGIKKVHDYVIEHGKRPRPIEVGVIVECIQCRTIYSVVEDRVILYAHGEVGSAVRGNGSAVPPPAGEDDSPPDFVGQSTEFPEDHNDGR